MNDTLTIDEILIKIEHYGFEKLNSSIPNRDKRILKNLAKMVKMPSFITENQGRLLIKILQENLESLSCVGSPLIPSLKTPTWSRSFNVVEHIRKINIIKDSENVPLIEIECNFNKDIKKVLIEVSKNIEGTHNAFSGKLSRMLLTEKNLYNIVTSLKKFNFELSPQIQSLFDEISKIDRKFYEGTFTFSEIKNEKLKKMYSSEVGHDKINDDLLLRDRRILFQYLTDSKNDKNHEKSLLNNIVDRKNNKIFVNSQNYTLTEVAEVMKKLRRLKTLCIFDEYNVTDSIENLKKLKKTLDDLNLTPNVGVYFRFSNQGDGERFNKLVSEFGWNKNLDDHTHIAVISNGKIPKFFLKSSWYPKSTISFSNQLRNNKTSVYCNECDLIVYYNKQAPIIGTVDEIL